jgi:hypothetical protein
MKNITCFIFITLTILLSGIAASAQVQDDRKYYEVCVNDIQTFNDILKTELAVSSNRETLCLIVEEDEQLINALEKKGLILNQVDNPLKKTMEMINSLYQTAGPESTGIPGYPCYRTVEETFATAAAIAANNPELAVWTDEGDSWEKDNGLGGYDMNVLVLTNSLVPGPKPKIFITSAIHAREYATAELTTRLAEYLVNSYGTDADATWVLDHHEIHLMLHTNPDGRKKAETGLSWRKNTNQNYCSPTSNNRGADLNRNFQFKWDCCGGSSSYECDPTYHGAFAASEPETQAVQNYIFAQFPDQRGPNDTDPAPDDTTGIYLDIHSHGRLVLWPWGWTSDPAPNATQLQTLGRKFAYFNGHSPEQSIGLYPTDGTTTSFAYGEMGIAAYTFEVGTAFFESCTYFENTLVPDNMPALLYAVKVPRTPYITPAGPDALNVAVDFGSGSPIPPETPVTLTATINDTRYNNSNGTEPTQDIAAAEYYIDVPYWVTSPTPVPVAMSASDGTFNSTVEDVQATIDTTGWSNGQHIVFVRGKDANNNWGAVSGVFINIDDTIQPDTTPPSPDPMTWASVPAATGPTSISMTATTATDLNGVEYYFECTSTGCNDSGWQDSPTYEDTGLTASTTYTYRVKARDKSPNQNETDWSTNESATTDDAPVWTELTYDDFESGWGNYSDGGRDCRRYTGGTHAHQGIAAINIQDNSGTSSSFFYTSGVDVQTPGYTQIEVDFWFKAVSMENGENFFVEYYDGSTWHIIASYARGTDFNNNQFYNEIVYIDEANYTFPTNMKIRFRCDASTNSDDVYIDEVKVSARN